MRNIWVETARLLRKGTPLALASILETRGSTPQVPGASALFTTEGLLSGTLGGGLLEADAQVRAVEALKKRMAVLYEFRLEGEISAETEPVCGGAVTLLIDALLESDENIFQEILSSLQGRRPGTLVTFVQNPFSPEIKVSRFWVLEEKRSEAQKFFLSPFLEDIRAAFEEGAPRLLRAGKGKYTGIHEGDFLFVEPLFPLPQLLIAGAGHVGQAVARLGDFLNFEVTVIDDRPEFACRERFPLADGIIVGDIGQAVQDFSVSTDTYIVIVTRGHSRDTEALRACIKREAAYIGMIGSSRKVRLVREKFLEEEWATPQEFDRLHAPIGLAIGSATVEEIAVSIAAQLVMVRSQNQERRRGMKK